jgi:hypothetical protein
MRQFSTAPTRRQWLQSTACGFGSLALAGLAADRKATAAAGLAARSPHFAPRAKRIIFLFMQGGPSHVDTFDYKPELARHHDQQFEFDDDRTKARTQNGKSSQRVMKSPWSFRRYGETGRWSSELFTRTARHIDDLCMVHSMHTDGVAHGPATLFLHCGASNFVRPSMGSWISYGLGRENENLPAFISICPSAGNGGARNYGSAFLPSQFQGTSIGRPGSSDLQMRNLQAPGGASRPGRAQLDLIQSLNRQQWAQRGEEEQLEGVIRSHELAWRMQLAAPEVFDLERETQATLDMYGIGKQPTDQYGRECLLARRLCEAGVRYIQVNYGDNSANPAWDQHSNLPKHADHAARVDQPIAALLTDLKQRGLLEDTLVWWGAEFGRTPYAQENGTGRDHNPSGFTMWMTGGGAKPGVSYGRTDAFGHQAIENKVHMHDMHATILHLMGLDHERLTYRYAGRDFRLTDVHGRVVEELVA